MRILTIVLSCLLLHTPLFAAEKGKLLMQLDATRATIESLAGKAGDNREAIQEIEQARSMLKKAQDAADKGKAFIVFGDLKPDAEQEIRNYLDMSDTLCQTAASRLERQRALAELETLEKQFAAVKAKVKLFDDRKAELEKLRTEAAKCAATAKELELAKAEKALLAGQIEQLGVERTRFDKLKLEQADLLRKQDELKADKASLTGQVERLQVEIRELKSELATARKPAPEKPGPEPAASPAAPTPAAPKTAPVDVAPAK